LQQTQVSRVVPKYEAFLCRFPTATDCADGTPAEVIELWQGLGYNRRAVNLHRCATLVRDKHGGDLPADRAALMELPGIGPYTARAVLAFAFEHDVAVVDTNVARILARQSGRTLGTKTAQTMADSWVPVGEGWLWNQTLLDLGATICQKRSPKCQDCPVSSTCVWRGIGPDPAVGSAGVSGGQSKFEGSDRQGRGRLVDALRLGPVAEEQVPVAMGWPDDLGRATRVAGTLVRDGLAVKTGRDYELPQA
jgi:A/G-specific adenine glycosylase